MSTAAAPITPASSTASREATSGSLSSPRSPPGSRSASCSSSASSPAGTSRRSSAARSSPSARDSRCSQSRRRDFTEPAPALGARARRCLDARRARRSRRSRLAAAPRPRGLGLAGAPRDPRRLVVPRCAPLARQLVAARAPLSGARRAAPDRDRRSRRHCRGRDLLEPCARRAVTPTSQTAIAST